MTVREFANQKALVDYAERKGLVFVWAFGKRRGQLLSPVAVFTIRQRLLSPDQYEIVDVRTSRGVRRAMLFPKLILQAEFAANATVRQRMAIKRERLRAKRAAKQETNVKAERSAAEGPMPRRTFASHAESPVGSRGAIP
jgi:hypothetical protein